MIRKPAVAGQFYPQEKEDLQRDLFERIEGAGNAKKKVLAVISPHAGYIYSGDVAACVYSKVDIPGAVIIMGPNHHGIGEPFAVMSQGKWKMPGGEININEKLAGLMLENSRWLKADYGAHTREHSVEVQLPFIQYINPRAEFVPVVMGRANFEICREIGKSIASAVKAYGEPVLIVASTDMTHYESQESAKQKDKKAIDKILALDAAGLMDTVASNNISMCGVIPTTITLIAARELEATRATLEKYATSGDVSGDYSFVVGYAGITIQ